jgi:hypothetical protein
MLVEHFSKLRPFAAQSLMLAALAAALLTALPAQAQRVITSSSTGNDGRKDVASSTLNECHKFDLIGSADACAGYFNYGEETAAVNALVASYQLGQPGTQWGGVTQVDGDNSGLFTRFGSGIYGRLQFQQDLLGSFVLALSGDWQPGLDNVRSAWSSYYLYDDVWARTGEFLEFALYGETADDPDTLPVETLTMRNLRVNKATIFRFAPTASSNVPEPGSLGLSALALTLAVALAGRWRRARRPQR